MSQISAEEFLKTPANELMSRFIASNQPLLVKGMLQKMMAAGNLVSFDCITAISLVSPGNRLPNESWGDRRVVRYPNGGNQTSCSMTELFI